MVTGYVALNGEPLPCRLMVGPGSWRLLWHAASPSCSRTPASRSPTSARELGGAGPSFETVFDPVGGAPAGDVGLDGDTVLGVRLAEDGGRVVLRLRYRTDVLDADSAARIAGYHLAALTLIAADPDAEHGRQTLLSAEERRLPDRRARRAAAGAAGAPGPRAVRAAGAGAPGPDRGHLRRRRRWTYAELNARANRLARALLARGLRREGIVGGGDRAQPGLDGRRPGDLQGRRRVPADRAALPGRSHRDHAVARWVRAGADRDRQHHARSIRPSTRCPESGAVHRRGLRGGPRRRRPRRRTSRPTSSPTSTSPPAPPASPRARCASTRACSTTSTPRSTTWRSARGQVVAQTAPQCFDISLVAAGVRAPGRRADAAGRAGGDPGRRAVRRHDRPTAGSASSRSCRPTSKCVLSYLEQHPRELPDLRCVSVTGEALKKELAQRWFAAEPGIRLVNAYGLTETSDDTNHEVMDRAPDARPGPARAGRQQRARLRRRRAPVSRCRSALPARSSSPGSASAAATSTTPSAPGGRSWPTRTARASGCTGAATTAAGCRRASWSSSAAATARSRSAASGSRSARSRTPCCGCPASATAPWWSPERRRPAKAPGGLLLRPSGRSRPACCGTGWPRRCPDTWSRRPSTGGKACR